MKKKLTIGWLYPELMSTYGDRGNIITLTQRCKWRNLNIEIVHISSGTKIADIRNIDLIFGGGAQDREQEIVMRDLRKEKGEIIKELIENGIPALFVCGAPQLMGKFYEPALGERIEGLGIFDIETKNPGPNAPRLIGNVAAEVLWENMLEAKSEGQRAKSTIVGFENHGGRTYLGKTAKPFAKVLKGNGNNGEDGTEGVVYNNAIGCYFHGPLLPKNPVIADWLIKVALEKKYKEEITLEPLDDSLEEKAQQAIMRRLGVSSR
jgi:CobQ-like glutamine amidotransferase family enzyme